MADETRRIPPLEPTEKTQSEQSSVIPEVEEPTAAVSPVGETTSKSGVLPESDEPTVPVTPVTAPGAEAGTIENEPTIVNGKSSSPDYRASADTPPADEGDDWPSFDWKEGFSSWTDEDIAGTEAPGAEHTEAPAPQDDASDEEQEEQPDRGKKKKKRTLAGTLFGALAYLFGVLLVSYALATLAWDWANDVLALNKEELTASVTITESDTLDSVADTLKANKLIEHPFLFKIFAKLTHKTVEDGKIIAGTYELTTNMDYSALLTNIGPRSTSRETVTVMIPEGSTAQETFALLEENGVCSVEELEEEAANGDFSDYAFLSDVTVTGYQRLEGYLFPDTYEFYMSDDANNVLCKFLDNFEEQFTGELLTQAESMGFTRNEILIVASIIEKETDGSDQTDIASVIYNRLATGNSQTNGYLQMDSTIQYLLDERKESLTAEDLAIDSPYNTYLYKGLPVGCICSPGLEAIQAALNPTDTDYYYFALGDDGVTHFFSDYDDFVNFRNSLSGT